MKTGLKEVNSYTRELNVSVEWEKLSAQFENEAKKKHSLLMILRDLEKGRFL